MKPKILIMQRQHGFTLLEALIVIAIIAILATLAVPSFNEHMQQQRVKGATETLVAALQTAKAEAIKRNQDIRLVFTPNAANTSHATWCYGLTSKPDSPFCDCNITDEADSNYCEGGNIVSSADYRDVSIHFTQNNRRTFNQLRGATTTGTVTFSTGNNIALGVRTFSIGTIRICVPDPSNIRGYTDSGAC